MRKSKDVLNNFAKIASQEFLGSQKTPLEDSLKKIAKQEGLTPDQIMYVTSEANRDVWAQLFKLDKTASYNFNPVDPRELVSQLQIKEPIKKTAATLDYMVAPTHQKEASTDGYEVEGSFSRGDDVDSALERRALKQELTRRMEKVALAKEHLETDLVVLRSQAEILERNWVKEARQHIIQTPFTERADAMDKIAEFVAVAVNDNKELGRQLMSKLAFVISKQGLVKEADLKAPVEYISETMPARIVNGNHTLYITIDTLSQKHREISDRHRQWLIVDGSLGSIKEKVREL